jgi:integrase
MEIRVPGVKTYRSRGKVYAYHRATGTRLKTPIGTAAFLAEIERLDGAVVKTDARPGTLGALIEAYRRSPEFAELAPRTRSDYQKVFDYLKPLAADRLAEINSSYVIEARDAAFVAHKRRFANYVVAVLRLLLKWGEARDLIAVNAAAAVPKLRRPRSAPVVNRAWGDDEGAAVLVAATGGVKVAIALGMFAGMREGDAVSVTRAAYDGAWLRWKQGKTGNDIEVPVDPRLKAILDAEIERRATSPVAALTLVIGDRGRPYTGNGFRAMFFRLVRRLAQEGKVRPSLTFHGLRHTAGRTLAERGAEPRMIAALLGHRTLAMAAHYSEEANRRKLATAAITKLAPRKNRTRREIV